jgi:hypothetical protein
LLKLFGGHCDCRSVFGILYHPGVVGIPAASPSRGLRETTSVALTNERRRVLIRMNLLPFASRLVSIIDRDHEGRQTRLSGTESERGLEIRMVTPSLGVL